MIKKAMFVIGIIGALFSGVWSDGLSPQPLEQTGTNVTLITAEQIQAAATQDISQLLNRLTGVDLPKQASLGNNQVLSIRGLSGNQVLIMIDGYPFNSTLYGWSDLSQIPLENIERIEIVRGAASALYSPNAVGGAVNIITKKIKEKSPKTEITLFGSSFNTQTYSFSYGAKPGDLDYLLSSSHSFSKGWRKNNDYENNALSLHLGYDFHHLGQVMINNQYYRGRLGVPGISNIHLEAWDNAKEREASSPNAQNEDHSNLTFLEYKLDLNKQITTRLKTYLNEAKQVYRNTDCSIDNSRWTSTRGATLQVERNSQIITGFEYREDSLWQRNNDLQMDVINEAIFFKSLYTQYCLKKEAYLLTLGIRYDHHTLSGGQFNPRFSLTYFLMADWKASVNISRGFSPPTLNDLFRPLNQETYYGITYIAQGNRNLQPEKAVSYDLGLENSYKDILHSKASIFYISTKDLILWKQEMLTLTTYRYIPKNLQGRNFGLELEENHQITKTIKYTLNYTLMQAQAKKENETNYLFLAFRPKHKLNYIFTYEPLATFQFLIENQWFSKSYEQNGEKGVKIPSASIWNVKLNKKINDLVLSFKTENIFNERYARLTDGFGNFYPLPGRTFWFSMALYFRD